MRTIFFILLLYFATTLSLNEVAAQNIVPEAEGVKVVVIDAGHGGKFPGACYANIKEKEMTLNVALRLGKLIEEGMPGVKVVYTRKKDIALGETLADDLQARADSANRNNGNLFISIHVNAGRSPSAKGVETLIMGETSKEQRYNEEALFDNNREDLIDMSDQREAAIVRAYIQNLQFTYGQYSMALAQCMQESYRNAGRKMRGIKPQLLRVLYAVDMPAVLTEIGFMSNPEEAAYMKSERGQAEIARSLYNAVKDYAACIRGVQGIEEIGSGMSVSAKPVSESEVVPAAEAGIPAKAEESVREKSVSKSEPAAKRVSGGGYYAVQVMASVKVVPLTSSHFKSYKNKVKQYASQGTFRYKYCVGEFRDKSVAQKRLAEVKKVFPDAFVVRCEGGEIVK